MEMGLAREPGRFLKMLIASDPLHGDNHVGCSKSFNRKLYTSIEPLNKEACAQFNSLLWSVQSSVTYMTYNNYLQAINICIAFYNLCGIESRN